MKTMIAGPRPSSGGPAGCEGGTGVSESIERRALEWLFSRDTGSSSKSIAKHMLGIKGYVDYPSDEGDLGRCVRLLYLIAEWKPRIAEMAAYGAVWPLYVENWDDLVGRHKRADGSTYTVMRRLRAQANGAGNG